MVVRRVQRELRRLRKLRCQEVPPRRLDLPAWLPHQQAGLPPGVVQRRLGRQLQCQEVPPKRLDLPAWLPQQQAEEAL